MFALNRAWMYNRLHPSREGIKPRFYEGVEEFITACVRIEQFTREETIRCSCGKCKCRRFLDLESIKYHLYKDGFKPDYWVWTEHREALPLENQFGVNYIGSNSTRGVHVGNKQSDNITWEDNLSHCEHHILSFLFNFFFF